MAVVGEGAAMTKAWWSRGGVEQLLDELDCMKIFRVLPLWTQQQKAKI